MFYIQFHDIRHKSSYLIYKLGLVLKFTPNITGSGDGIVRSKVQITQVSKFRNWPSQRIQKIQKMTKILQPVNDCT